MGTTVHNSGESGHGPYEYALGDELRGERATLGKTLLDIQRDLRIKAAYIAAIEDAKPEVFPNPSFIAGYVRSYARYLSLDPDEVFRRFCQESGFVGSQGGQAKLKAGRRRVAQPMPGGFRPDFPLTRLQPRGCPRCRCRRSARCWCWSGCSPGSGTAAGRCCRTSSGCSSRRWRSCRWRWPRWTRSTRRRQRRRRSRSSSGLESPVAATALADLYRQQEAEVPILVPRDGPIAALDPDRTGLLARPAPAARAPARRGPRGADRHAVGAPRAGPGRSRRPGCSAAGRRGRAGRLDPDLPGKRHGPSSRASWRRARPIRRRRGSRSR